MKPSNVKLSPEQYLNHLVAITKSLLQTGVYTVVPEDTESDGLLQGAPEVASPLVTDAAERILDFLILRAERIADGQSESPQADNN